MEGSKEGVLMFLSTKNLDQLYKFHNDLIYEKILWISELNLLFGSNDNSINYQRFGIIFLKIYNNNF